MVGLGQDYCIYVHDDDCVRNRGHGIGGNPAIATSMAMQHYQCTHFQGTYYLSASTGWTVSMIRLAS
jgi:hypothetical protein